MNCIYIFLHGITEKVTFAIPLDMRRKVCALFDIRGKVKPFTDGPLSLCINFIELSTVRSNKQMPILCKINLLKDELMGGGIIDPMYNKILWLPTNHSPLKEIQLYITNRHRRFAPLVDCNIDCTLVFIPHTK